VPISVVIIAKDEADRIRPCIAAATEVSDDIVVLDSGSTDDTVNIARAAGATVVQVDWLGYGATKNLGHTYAKHDWILSLDADEVLSDQLISSLHEVIPTRGTVYLLDRMVKMQDQYIRHSGWHPDWVYRLYHKEDCKWDSALVHEKLVLPAGYTTSRLVGVLTHYSFRSIDHFRAKTDQYARLAASQWLATGRQPSIAKQLMGPWWKYVQTYYLYRGFLDGKLGKVIAQTLADGVRKKIQYYKELA